MLEPQTLALAPDVGVLLRAGDRSNVETMARDDKARFRITAVPGRTIEFPPVSSLYGEHWIGAEARRTGETEEGFEVYPERDVQFGEVYLELFALDLKDSEAIDSFVERYGVLGTYSLVWGSEHCNHYMGFPGQPLFAEATAALAAEVGRGGRLDSYWENEAEFCFGAECLRDMTNAWRIVKGEIAESEVKWLCPCWENSEAPIRTAAEDGELRRHFRRFAPHARAATPGLVLHYGMQESLKPFSPTLVTFDDVLLAWPDPDLTPYGGEIPLFSILCLELFNHIVEEAAYRRCANQKCERLFVRQSGRALHGQHRTRGVKYCSASCARAQAQREYRRRRAGTIAT